MSDVWYIDADDYYVAAEEAHRYPLRQGDLLAGPELDGERWHAAQLVHPTCELTKPTLKRVQLVRVRPLDELADDQLRALAVAGFSEDAGHRRVALAHTFFLPPPEQGSDPAIANFREIASVDRALATSQARLGTLTHDCRVSFVRRWLYFRFRLAFSFEQVRAWEARRISADAEFTGPRPAWAGGPAQ